jgi:hypothetical protein
MRQVLAGKRIGLAVLAALVGLSSISCGAMAIQPRPDRPPQQAKPTPVAQAPKPQTTPKIVNPKLIDANTSFGFKLFQEIQKQAADENVFISPSSVAIALAMTYNGANGATQSAMNQALQLNGLSLEDLTLKSI